MYMELNEKNLASVYKNASSYLPKSENSESTSETETTEQECPIEAEVELEKKNFKKNIEEATINLSSILQSNKLIYSFVENLEKSVEEILTNIKDYIDYSNEKLETFKTQILSDTDNYNSKMTQKLDSLRNQVMNDTNNYNSRISKYMS